MQILDTKFGAGGVTDNRSALNLRECEFGRLTEQVQENSVFHCEQVFVQLGVCEPERSKERDVVRTVIVELIVNPFPAYT